jgi:hypothetical protein
MKYFGLVTVSLEHELFEMSLEKACHPGKISIPQKSRSKPVHTED